MRVFFFLVLFFSEYFAQRGRPARWEGNAQDLIREEIGENLKQINKQDVCVSMKWCSVIFLRWSCNIVNTHISFEISPCYLNRQQIVLFDTSFTYCYPPPRSSCCSERLWKLRDSHTSQKQTWQTFCSEGQGKIICPSVLTSVEIFFHPGTNHHLLVVIAICICNAIYSSAEIIWQKESHFCKCSLTPMYLSKHIRVPALPS